MTDNRKSMDPSTLETIIMLRMNKDLWDERDVEAMIHEEKETSVTAGNRRPRDEDDFDNEDKFDSPLQTDFTPLKSK
jgi:hypothetical protein